MYVNYEYEVPCLGSYCELYPTKKLENSNCCKFSNALPFDCISLCLGFVQYYGLRKEFGLHVPKTKCYLVCSKKKDYYLFDFVLTSCTLFTLLNITTIAALLCVF